MRSDNLIKISDNRVHLEDISYSVLNGFYIDTEMSGQSDSNLHWISEDKSFSVDICTADVNNENFIECFAKYFPDDYKKLADFTEFEYNGLTGVYVIIGLSATESFEFKAYANKEKTKFIDVVIETKNGNIYNVLKLKSVQNFLHDIRMD